MSREGELILLTLDQAYDRKPSHGSNPKGPFR